MTHAKMDNRQLRNASELYVKRLRDFGDLCRSEDRVASDQEFEENIQNRGKETPEQTRIRLEQMVAINRARGKQQQGHFNREFRVDGSLLYEELVKRTGSQRVRLLILDGIFAGPDPMEDVANEIETLAKMLEVPGEVLPFRVK